MGRLAGRASERYSFRSTTLTAEQIDDASKQLRADACYSPYRHMGNGLKDIGGLVVSPAGPAAAAAVFAFTAIYGTPFALSVGTFALLGSTLKLAMDFYNGQQEKREAFRIAQAQVTSPPAMSSNLINSVKEMQQRQMLSPDGKRRGWLPQLNT
jgi:hypothetical protein